MQLNVILYNDSVDTVALEQVGNVKAGARTNFAAAFRAIEEFVAVGAVAVLFLSDGFDTSNEDYWSELERHPQRAACSQLARRRCNPTLHISIITLITCITQLLTYSLNQNTACSMHVLCEI